MTLYELKNDVARLGFESYVEDEDTFLASANRALSLIYVDRPVSKRTVLHAKGPIVSLAREFIEHRSGDVITIPFSGKSISFRSSGTGTCIIKDPSGSNLVPLSTDSQLTKRFVKGDGTITLSGDFYFTVTNLAVFDDLISDQPTDIPEYSPYNEISIKECCNDFRAFLDQPRDKNGNVIESIKLIDGRVCVPYNYRGDIHITYYRTPAVIGGANENERIDISDECAPMLPLLTASFTWLDDDAAKAQYYMSLYRDLIANVKRYSTNKIDTVYRVNGWA